MDSPMPPADLEMQRALLQGVVDALDAVPLHADKEAAAELWPWGACSRAMTSIERSFGQALQKMTTSLGWVNKWSTDVWTGAR